jgi:enhancing lycopene biosynthesis protein 2
MINATISVNHDGSSSNNQIQMAPADEEKTFFWTLKGIYCYKGMSFGLKNTCATYQKAMQKIFYDMFHQHFECYVDDLVVKSKEKKIICMIFVLYLNVALILTKDELRKIHIWCVIGKIPRIYSSTSRN